MKDVSQIGQGLWEMKSRTYGTVTALEYSKCPRMTFADIVDEFDFALQMVDSHKRGLIWDFEDIAIIEHDTIQLALGWLPSEERGMPWHLVIAVGGTADQDPDLVAPTTFDFATDQIIERLNDFLPFDAVMRGDAHQPIGADLIDSVFDLLRMDTNAGPQDCHAPVQETTAADFEDIFPLTGAAWTSDDAGPVDPHSKGPLHCSASSDHETLFTKVDEGPRGPFLLSKAEPTQPLRLTIHALALSLMLYVPPLGAAMFAYTMMRDVAPITA